MLKQTIDGVTKSINANGSSADVGALIGILVGEITEYDLKFQGGTEMPTMPSLLNKKVLIVGSKATASQGRLSSMVTLPHVKTSKTFNEISVDIKNKFNANYESAIKADYVTLKFDK
ncbi:hypothetical protein A9K75_09580 [Campylobacter fetus subsp. testudinum]|uniref:hypothetical protein n=1 Tax=Campylobacter fetus TaxID=196 RepID=UPI00081891F4|nr:hypothetical protein [Campylobacter fetus]OCR98861.1 hypothetical protein A9K75_09580 [Campylobacter fetus subsp. testudinum]